MRVKGIGQYLEETFGVTEFFIKDKRFVKTSAGTWMEVK